MPTAQVIEMMVSPSCLGSVVTCTRHPVTAQYQELVDPRSQDPEVRPTRGRGAEKKEREQKQHENHTSWTVCAEPDISIAMTSNVGCRALASWALQPWAVFVELSWGDPFSRGVANATVLRIYRSRYRFCLLLLHCPSKQLLPLGNEVLIDPHG